MPVAISTKTLDHIVHLAPPGSVQETSEQFRKLGFKVIPGGTHTDGLTANALVVFADGVYLELLSFTHPKSHYPPGTPERQKRDNHEWATKTPGWIDFAFLGNGSLQSRISDIINERAKKDQSGAFYVPEWPAGRKRPDGKVLKWVISAPTPEKRGTLPFFCGDVTPREWRVPGDPASNTDHPSTAHGIAYVRVLTSARDFPAISLQLASVIGNPPVSASEKEVKWVLDTVNHKGPKLILQSPDDDDDELAFVNGEGTGIYEVAFLVNHEEGAGDGNTPYGKVRWIPEA